MKSQCQTLTLRHPASKLSDYPALHKDYVRIWNETKYPDIQIPEGWEPTKWGPLTIGQPYIWNNGRLEPKGNMWICGTKFLHVRPVPDVQVKWWEDSGDQILSLSFNEFVFCVSTAAGRNGDLLGVSFGRQTPSGECDVLSNSHCAPEDEFDFATGARVALHKTRTNGDTGRLLDRALEAITDHQKANFQYTFAPLSGSAFAPPPQGTGPSILPPDLTQTTLRTPLMNDLILRVWSADGFAIVTESYRGWDHAKCYFSQGSTKKAFARYVSEGWICRENKALCWNAYFEAFPEDKRRG